MKSKTLILTILLVAGLLLVIFSISKQGSKRPPATVHLTAPDIEVQDAVHKRKLSSLELKNKVLFINFWASWCKPCREEMPSIQALYNEMMQNGDFMMITILYKESAEDGMEYMKKNGYTFPVYIDHDGNTAENYGVTGVPETYLVNRKGILKKRVIGPSDWNSDEEKNFIYALLNE